jgi:predicted deacylase
MSWVERLQPDAPREVERLDLDELARGETHHLSLALVEDAAARVVRIPLLVAHGAAPGPVVGLTAALHGNELNGIRTIHRLFTRVEPQELSGTVVAVAVVNMPGFLSHRREYNDGRDLNRLMPGRADGTESQVYAHRFLDRVARHFEYLIDLHTASFGRINSLYVRVDMKSARSAQLARWLGAEIIVHNAGRDGTLRAAAAERGIPAVTVEIGDPQVLEQRKIRASRIGLRDVLENLGMLAPDSESAPGNSVECEGSYWLYTDAGGILEVIVKPTERVQAGQLVARLHDPWGRLLRRYFAPEDGIVVGCSTNPVAHTGARILHLGIVRSDGGDG